MRARASISAAEPGRGRCGPRIFSQQERDRTAGEGDEPEQLVVVDLAEARATILVTRGVAVVLDAEGSYLLDTGSKVGNRVDVQVVHHVAGIVVDLDPGVVNLAHNVRARGSRPGLTAVLLDDDRDATIARHGSKLLEPLDPEFAVASAGVAEGEYLGNATRPGLEDPPPEDVQGLVGLGVDAREHHERFQAEVATSLAQFARPVGRCIAAEGWASQLHPCPHGLCPRRHAGSLARSAAASPPRDGRLN